MFEKFLEKIGEGLTERWSITKYGLALIFLIEGILTYANYNNVDLKSEITKAIEKVKEPKYLPLEILITFVLLLLIAFLNVLIESLQSWAIKRTEGYLPQYLSGVQIYLNDRSARKIKKKREQQYKFSISTKEVDKIKSDRLRAELARLPVDYKKAMPTLFGNLLRAAEEHPEIRYGLNAIVCWSRLYPLLPDVLRKLIDRARANLNESASLLIWSILSLIWLCWKWWWALLSLPVACLAYRSMVLAAGTYGDLIRSSFDLYRFDLYKAVHWPLPSSPKEEKEAGKNLTWYLFSGQPPENLTFDHGEKKNERSESKIKSFWKIIKSCF